MSEYWKSTPKYWCKHCSTYVKDTPFEKKQHESTGKHQGALKRFLRDIQNSHERDGREKQKAKAEAEKLNKQFGGSQPMSPTLASTYSTKSGSTSKIPASVADRKRQLAQLVELGIQIPDEQRADLALAGQWKTVSQRILDEQPMEEEQLSVGVRKRKYEGQDEEEEAGETVVKRGWGSTTRVYPRDKSDDIDNLLSLPTVERTEDVTPEKRHQTTEPDQIPQSDADKDPASQTLNAEKKELDEGPALADIPLADHVPIFRKRKPKSSVT